MIGHFLPKEVFPLPIRSPKRHKRLLFQYSSHAQSKHTTYVLPQNKAQPQYPQIKSPVGRQVLSNRTQCKYILIYSISVYAFPKKPGRPPEPHRSYSKASWHPQPVPGYRPGRPVRRSAPPLSYAGPTD